MCQNREHVISRRSVIRTLLGGATGLLLAGAPSALADATCPLCGCGAHHCDAGVPEHLKCRLATAAERNAILERQAKLLNAEQEGLLGSPTTACNEVAGRIADSMGYTGFGVTAGYTGGYMGYMTADQIYNFVGSSPDWEAVPDPTKTTEYAGVGRMVIGVIQGADLGEAHGHVFTVVGGSYDDSGRSFQIEDAAYTKSLPRKTTLNVAVKKEDFDDIRYYALKP